LKPRSPENFSPIGQRTAEKLQFLSVTDYDNNRLQTHESQEAGKTIVCCDLPIATDKNQKGGRTKKPNILALYENENLKRGTEKKIMSLCKNIKNQRGGRTEKNPILSLYENENIKKGDEK
jgi:hypothetical protein